MTSRYKSQYPSFSYEENSFDFKNYKLKDSIVLRKDFISKGVTILKIKNDDPEKICDEFKKLGDFSEGIKLGMLLEGLL